MRKGRRLISTALFYGIDKSEFKLNMKKTDKALTIYDTFQREAVQFQSIHKGKVGLYACGPTVYDYAHIGNLRTYLFVDLLRRTIEFNGYQLNHVMNITDVGHLVSDGDDGEDKMEKGSRKHSRSAWDIAVYFEEKFLENLDALNILRPTTICRATDHIQEQIEFIQDIEAKGFTYRTSDGVYFDTSKQDNYGYLARLNKEGLRKGARVEFNQKKHTTDFALWKFSGEEKRQMEWQSPWGKGFPGWHIECSAMAEKYLGKLFDIHVGGEDHISVHHSNEIAQSLARNQTRPANYWMHGFFLQIDNEKVAKSGQSLLLSDLIERKFSPLSFRYLVLTAHYRSRLNFTWESLLAASNSLNKIKFLMGSWPNDGRLIKEYLERFIGHLNNDLDTPRGLALIWELIKSPHDEADKKVTLTYFDKILGLNLNHNEDFQSVPKDISALAEQREVARKNKDWLESDRLRDEINERGYVIEDQKRGYQIYKNYKY